jgi:hypothetical protein
LHPKRTHTHDDAGDAHEMLAEVENWDLRDHRQQATRIQNRHNVQAGSHNNQSNPLTDTEGFLHHTCLGLVGSISYWCLGDSIVTVFILVALINTLGLTLDEIKNFRTDQQRVEFHITLSCVMTPGEEQGNKNGWIKPICVVEGCTHGDAYRLQTRELWSPQEERQMCPGHFWLMKFGKVPGNNRFVDEDASGLTFEEWDPSADNDVSEAPLAMIVNSFRPQRSDTATTRDGGAWSPTYVRRGPQSDSRYGYQEVCTLRG